MVCNICVVIYGINYCFFVIEFFRCLVIYVEIDDFIDVGIVGEICLLSGSNRLIVFKFNIIFLDKLRKSIKVIDEDDVKVFYDIIGGIS